MPTIRYFSSTKMTKYHFSGWQAPKAQPINNNFPTIHNQFDLYDELSKVWGAETCAPRMRHEWSKENKTKWQCSITAFLVQDIFGGKVYGIPLKDGSFHCYNVINEDIIFDLTSEQFGKEAKDLVYENNPEQFRENHFAKEEKRIRYELLKQKLLEIQ